MTNFWSQYWPHIAVVLAVVLAAATVIHSALTKDDVRSAIGWSGIAVFSPFFGAILYAIAGVNRVRRTAVRKRRSGRRRSGWNLVSAERVTEAAGPQFVALRELSDRVSSLPVSDRNSITLLSGGDAAYAVMLEAIRSAKRSIAMQTYILDHDAAGLAFVAALAEAKDRGVAVRVLVDGIGVRYSRPRITGELARRGVPFALFLGRFVPWRWPYANLRSHRKILVVDGTIGFTGGMNIRAGFAGTYSGGKAEAHDTHFRLEGPVVAHLFRVLATDWSFTTGERLTGRTWAQGRPFRPGTALCRPIDSGPDEGLERTHSVILGALSVAQKRVRILSPYFLPDLRIVASLGVAARRGVQVDIVIPEASNLRLVDWAVAGQIAQVIRPGCNVWRAEGHFDHSKLMVVDGAWALIGSSNMDARSHRLNFETDIEVMDRESASVIEAEIEDRMAGARRETLGSLAAKPPLIKVRNRLIWLASPYL
ncbi:MAG: phosphatidylserine/phosphatidylglycerophosphate/cardiolipin synthase family protein [Bauldia sp.]